MMDWFKKAKDKAKEEKAKKEKIKKDKKYGFLGSKSDAYAEAAEALDEEASR